MATHVHYVKCYKHRGYGIANWLTRIFNTVLAWQRWHQERRHLLSLDDHMLRDIGLSRDDVAREVDKPFWRP